MINIYAEISEKTLFINSNHPKQKQKTFLFTAEPGSDLSSNERHKREVSSLNVSNATIITKVIAHVL